MASDTSQQMTFFTFTPPVAAPVTAAAGEPAPREPQALDTTGPVTIETEVWHTDPDRAAAALAEPMTRAPGQRLHQELRSIYRTTYYGADHRTHRRHNQAHPHQPSPARPALPRVDYTRTLETLWRRADSGPTVASECEHEITLRRTAGNLVLMRTRAAGQRGTWRIIWAQALGAGSDGVLSDALAQRAPAPLDDAAVREHLGALPCVYERVPLLDHLHRDAVPAARLVNTQTSSQVPTLPLAVISHWIDQPNAAEVARAAFGPANYRRALARLVARVHPAYTAFYAHFADLVPIEHLIEAMEDATADNHHILLFRRLSQADHGRIRSLLQQLPGALLSRLLRQTDTGELVMALRDGAAMLLADPPVVEDYPHLEQVPDPHAAWAGLDNSGRDVRQLGMLITQMGHRRLRGVGDVEQLISRLPAGTRPGYRQRLIRAGQLERLDLLAEQAQVRRLREVNAERARLDDPLEPLTWQQWADPVIRTTEQERFADALARQQAEREQAAARAEQELIARRQRQDAGRARDCEHTTALLDKTDTVAGYQVVVARDAATLSRWGVLMGNCIGSYSNRLGLSTMAALFETGADPDQDKPVVNFQIESGRITQVLCRRNRPLAEVLGVGRGQQVLDELCAIGGWSAHRAWGSAGLVT